MSAPEQSVFDNSVRRSQQEVYGIDPVAFTPYVSAVFCEPKAGKVLLVPVERAHAFPSVKFDVKEPVTDAFARLAVDELGISTDAITRVSALHVPNTPLTSTGPNGALEYHIGFKAIVTDMSEPSFPGVKWLRLTTAENCIARNPNVAQRDLGVMLLGRFVST